MEILFNKNQLGTEELKRHLGFIYASNDFSEITSELFIASADIKKIIGKETYAKAITHYKGNDYDPSGDATLDRLVFHIQLPVALFAYLDFAPSKDLSHDGNGRKIVVNDNQKAAFEHQIDRHEASILKRAHKAVDMLLEFLDEKVADIEEWKNSDAKKEAHKLFVPNAQTFNTHFPIEGSRRIYLHLLPFIQQAESNHIRPALGPTRFNELKAALISNNGPSPEQKTLIKNHIQLPIVLHSMALGARFLSSKVLPEGIMQPYTSERLTTRATKATVLNDRQEMAANLKAYADGETKKLQDHIQKLELEENYIPNPSPAERNSPENKFFRT